MTISGSKRAKKSPQKSHKFDLKPFFKTILSWLI
jgi:hypothetical protein